MLDKLESIKAETLLITDRSNKHASKLRGPRQQSVTIPAALGAKSKLPEEIYTPIPYIVPAQLFAVSLAEVKHVDPDHPRTLNKVTQTM